MPSQSGSPGSGPPGWAWWVIGIVIPVLGIAATVRATSAKTPSSSAAPVQGPRTTPPESAAVGRAPNRASPASSSPTGAVPAVFPGGWEGSISDEAGEHHRRLTVRQGKVGDETEKATGILTRRR
ncbi:hypothetical protein [Streptomyces yangpuensis]|uniref:hypothetical protein n=1 Tax=Streptomyces yangpuensis TaxID=1648182 RepID=UPI0038259ACC